MNFFKDLFESIPDYRKIVEFLFSIKNDVDLLNESDSLRNDINRLRIEFEIILIERNGDYLEYNGIEENSTKERILNK